MIYLFEYTVGDRVHYGDVESPCQEMAERIIRRCGARYTGERVGTYDDDGAGDRVMATARIIRRASNG